MTTILEGRAGPAHGSHYLGMLSQVRGAKASRDGKSRVYSHVGTVLEGHVYAEHVMERGENAKYIAKAN